jgi:hypothetical protein
MHIMQEMGVDDVTPILYMNSQSIFASIQGNVFRGTGVAHIATKFHLAAKMVWNKGVEMEYALSDEMVADALTMAPVKLVFLRLRELIVDGTGGACLMVLICFWDLEPHMLFEGVYGIKGSLMVN